MKNKEPRKLTPEEVRSLAEGTPGSKLTGQMLPNGDFAIRWFATLDGKPVGLKEGPHLHESPESALLAAIQFKATATARFAEMKQDS